MFALTKKAYEMGSLIAASMFRKLLLDVPGATALMKGSHVLVAALPDVHAELERTAKHCIKAAAFQEAQRMRKIRESRARTAAVRRQRIAAFIGPRGGPPKVRRGTGRGNMINSVLLSNSPDRQRKMYEGRLTPRWHVVFNGAHLKPLLERVKNPPRCVIDPENEKDLRVFVNAYQLMKLRTLARGKAKRKRHVPQQYHLPPYLFGMSPALALERLLKRGVNAEKGNNCVLVIGKGQTQRKARRILYGN